MVLLVGMAMASFISRGVSMSMLARPIGRGRPAVITVTMTRGMAWIMSRSVVWHGRIWWRVGDMNGVEVTRTRSGRHQSAWSRVVVVPRIAVIVVMTGARGWTWHRWWRPGCVMGWGREL